MNNDWEGSSWSSQLMERMMQTVKTWASSFWFPPMMLEIKTTTLGMQGYHQTVSLAVE